MGDAPTRPREVLTSHRSEAWPRDCPVPEISILFGARQLGDLPLPRGLSRIAQNIACANNGVGSVAPDLRAGRSKEPDS